MTVKLDARSGLVVAWLALVGWRVAGMPGVDPHAALGNSAAGPAAPAPPGTPPAPSVQQQLEPVRALLRGHADAVTIGAAFAATADFVAADNRVTTTDQVRRLWPDAQLVLASGRKSGPAGLAAAVDAFLVQQLGLESVPLDAAKRAQVVAAFRALAWAAGG